MCRGGGEYGTEWRNAGSLGNKQNVFDDFQACAEHLIADRYCSPSTLSIQVCRCLLLVILSGPARAVNPTASLVRTSSLAGLELGKTSCSFRCCDAVTPVISLTAGR